MRAVKYLVKLYEVSPEDGQISAFDTYASTIFTGTDRGILLRFTVEGAGLPDAAPPTVKESCGIGNNDNSSANTRAPSQSAHNDPLAPAPEGSERIYTTLMRRAVLSATQRRIERLQHSRTQNLLFVLCEHRLVVLNSVTFSHIQTIAEHIGTFFVSDSQQNSPQRAGLHVICASELNGRGLSVFEFDASQGKHARAILAQELVLPELVQVLVTYGSIACIGMRREYSLLSLSDGNSCGVLALGGGRQPLLAAGDGEVFMRYNQSIFSVSMRSIPSGRILGRTIKLEDEVLSFVVRHPFLFAFTEQYCDVYSLCDDDVSERLPLPGCLFSSQLGRGDFLYAASKTKIWMASLHSLRHQLADLVERFKVEEAFHLLGSQRAKTAVDLQAIELELHIMAGFAYLHHCRPKEAMLHFNDHIDPRDLLLLLQECIPPNPDEYSPELQALLEVDGFRKPGDGAPVTSAITTTTTTEAIATTKVHGKNETEKVCAAEEKEEGGDSDKKNGFWAEWEGCCPYNTYVGELHNAWLETYETFPIVPMNSDPQHHLVYRQVPEWGATTAATFLECSWELFKDELILFFRSRLKQASDIYARAMEYALLVLALEAQDHRAAYRVVAYGSSLRVEDSYDLLSSLREYRLLACLLYRCGYTRAASHVLTSRVYVSSLLPPSVLNARFTSECATAYKIVPKSMRAQLDRLLSRTSDLPCTTGMQLRAKDEAGHPGQTMAATEASKALLPLPLSLSEVMYLVSTLNLAALQELLCENPEASQAVDEEGCTLLHVLFSLLVLHEDAKEDLASESRGALLNLVLSCALLLLDHGVCTAIVDRHGLSCLDVAAVAAGGAFFDIIMAALLAESDVMGVTLAVEKEVGEVTPRGA